MSSAFNISQTSIWRALQAHSEKTSAVRIRDLFAADADRFARYSKSEGLLFFDFSKNKVTDETLELLLALARTADLRERSRELLLADPVSRHVSTRDDPSQPLAQPSGSVAEAKSRMRTVSKAVRSGDKRGYSGKRIRHVINIGIGGSCLGPVMVSRVLAHLGNPEIRLHYISSIDRAQTNSVLSVVEPETSLFVAVSRSFTTRETLTNVQRVRDWLSDHYGNKTAWLDHFMVVTNEPSKAFKLGFSAEQCIVLPDRLGGRYSLWSATGLLSAIYIGMEQFERLLKGAHQADRHFFSQDLEDNVPMLQALFGLWNVNFQNIHAHAILPYNYALTDLVTHLQQLEMESNGKSVDRQGQAIAYQTVPVVWGGPAIEAQHTFYQMLYQGKAVVSSDFIIAAHGRCGSENDLLLFSDYVAQTHALMWGHKNNDPQKTHHGDQPSNSILLSEISPQALGMLLAFYEHKVYAQSLIWQTNPFDQWGIEWGKSIAGEILPSLKKGKRPRRASMQSDSSSLGLIRWYRQARKSG